MKKIKPFVFSDAVSAFWAMRSRQSKEQRRRGVSDQGGRGTVTGGRQMDGFVKKIADLLETVGIDKNDIHLQKRLIALPGFFRPTKEWDMVVVSRGRLVAAIELKSQVGPSFGNNFNNRTEEAIGAAKDIWTAYRERAFGECPAPWLGYLFLLEDCDASKSPVSVKEPHFKVFQEFRKASYARRYELLCRKLVLERLYTATCFLMADSKFANSQENYTEPAKDLSSKVFLRGLLRSVAP